MSTPNPKTKITESLREMEVLGRKITSEFQTHKWKMAAKAASDSIEKNRILGIIAAYESQHDLSKKYFEQAIKESAGSSYIVIDDYVKCLMMAGNLSAATEQLVKIIDLNIDQKLIENIVTLAMTNLDNRPIELLLSKLDRNPENEPLIKSLRKFAETITIRQSEYEGTGITMEIFRSLMDLIYKVFYLKFVGRFKFNFFGSFHDGMGRYLMMQVEALTPEEISELNDDLIDGLIELSEKYNFLDLSKLIIYFTSKKFDEEKAA